MSRRISSLNNSAVGIERDIGSEYDNIKLVADNLDAIVATKESEIDDAVTAADKTWSSSKIDASLGGSIDDGVTAVDSTWSSSKIVSSTTLDQVTANGSTTTNDISVGKLTSTEVQLSGGTGTQGTLSWNADEETVDLVNNGATLQLGQELHIHCRNNTGVAISDGVAVMLVGTVGASGRLLIAPLVSDGSIPATDFLGITTEVIGSGEDGKVTAFGKIRGLNTSAWSDSTTLYSDPAVPGGFTSTLPSAPNLKMPIAHVINSHANNGTITVGPGVGHNIHNGDRVEILSPDVNGDPQVDNSTLLWNSTAGRWENKTPTETKTALGIVSNVSTNLGYATAATTGTVTSSDGTDATLPAATTSLAGLLTGADKTKLDGIASGAQVNVITSDAPSDGTPYSRQDGAWVAGSTGTSWSMTFAQTGTLASGDMWMADVSTVPQTRALPLTPSVDDEVIIKDDLGNAHNNTITVAHNGNPIMGTIEDFTISTVFTSVRLKWSGAGWRIVS